MTGGAQQPSARIRNGASKRGKSAVLDPISLEVLRSRVEAIAEDSAVAIERTAISPVITEAHDDGATLLDTDGNLVAGGGFASLIWGATTRAVRATIERYGETIVPGDVFLANDPYSGGGLHPSDVVVQRPIFVGEQRVAWVALSAHMMDVGGMVAGGFAPAATDCFQEGLRLPPVRLFRAGVEVSDVWDIFRTNVRLAPLVEMDLRGLVAGSYVAQEKVIELVDAVGKDFFVEGVKALQDLSEHELRSCIAAIADGVYRCTGWCEWEDELYKVPCCLTVEGDRMIFDFEGAPPQAPHYFNSQPYILMSSMMMQFGRILAPDLPYTEGLVAPLEIRCPEASIVNACPPAPMDSGHVNVAMTASEAMLHCMRLALWATDPPVPASRFVHGWGGTSGMSVSTWSGIDSDDGFATWAMADGTGVGGPAGLDRDGLDRTSMPVGMTSPANTTDIEVLEAWYPMLVTERRSRPGVSGAGAHRSGSAIQMKFQPYHTEQLVGEMLGIREWMPLEGAAGGWPGVTASFLRHRVDGTVERISTKASGVVLARGESFEFRCPTAGGTGDPLDRDPGAVAQDVEDELMSVQDANEVYGVLLLGDGTPDVDATHRRRSEILSDRLERATPPVRPLSDQDVAGLLSGDEMPVYPGVVHRGSVVFAKVSGAPLAIAPYHWTDGCAVLEERHPGPIYAVVYRAYLDPRTGKNLHMEVVPEGEPRSFEVSPSRWIRTAVDNS